MKLHEQFQAARRAGTPLVAVKSLDYDATMQSLQKIINSNGDVTPLIQWDCIRGMVGRNDAGTQALTEAFEGNINPTTHPIDMLVVAEKLPFDSEATKPTNPILFVLNAHAYLEHWYGQRAEFIQALWNLRLPFRDSLRSIVLLGPDFNFPPELQHDILILDEPLPTEVELSTIVTETSTAFGTKLDEITTNKAVDALRGLVAFEAEQATAMSLSKQGLKVDELWQRKKQMISAHKALTVWVGGQRFEDIRGIEEAKRRFRRIIKGKKPIRVVAWIDEIEKTGIGNAGGDLSGTSSDQLGIILGEMQDREYTGALFVGVPGAAKSAFAKAVANEAGCITIKLDLGGAKGEGLVGQAENEIRSAFKVIEAVGGHGGAFFIATSNDIRIIKPELKRRFKSGIWFFDIPSKEERDAIWDLYLTKFSDVDKSGRKDVDDSNWTGAEIETCVTTAWEENVSLPEAARSIIPVAVSGKEDIERLRRESAGRYNSASYPGAYQLPTSGLNTTATAGRKFATEE